MATEANNIPEDLRTRYSDFRFLGSGAMGRVYKAYDKDLLKDVAIKLLLTNQTPEALVRFQREAKTASKLTHRNLVTIMDFGTTSGGQLYLVMEYADGRTLSSLIQSGPLKLNYAISIISQVCDGMSHAHSLGVIHRDLKPANILVEGDDLAKASVKVVDFGIAKLDSGDSVGHSVTQAGKVLGTPMYMSPEQISAKEIDGRADIYSTACILFHMLTGKHPYECESTIELLRAKLEKSAPRINETGEHSPVPAAVEDVVARCLAANPDDRFSTMAELKAALAHAILPESSPGVPLDQTMAKSTSKSTLKKFGLIAGAVLGGCLMILFMVNRLWQKEPQDRKIAEVAPTAVLKGNKLTETTAVTDYFTRAPRKPSSAPLSPASDASWIAVPRVPDEAIKKLVEENLEVDDLELENQDLITPRAFKYLAKLPKLSVLTLCGSAVNDECLRYLGKSKSLTKLNLTGTAVSDAGIVWLTKLPLVDLNLDGTNVTSEAMKSLVTMKSLKRLAVARVKRFDNDGMKAISSLPLTLFYVESTKITDEGMKYLPGKHSLNQLFIGTTSIGEPGLRQIASYPLTELYMDGCKNVDDHCAEFIAKTWPNLKVLRLSDTSIQANGIKSIGKLKLLKELKLGALQVTDEDLTPLFELKELGDLSLRGIPITDKTLERAAGLTKLQSIEVTHCKGVTENGIASLQQRMPGLQIIQPEQAVKAPGMVEMWEKYQ